MEQTKSNAGAFVDEAKLQMDAGFRNITNNIAFELFGDGTATRGYIGAGATNPSGNTYVIPLSNAQNIVQFEVGMTLVNFVNSAGTISSISSTTGSITAVNRSTGVITILASGY
jgi:phage tail sheath gpL-like